MEVMTSKAISTIIKGSWQGVLIFLPGKCFLDGEGEVNIAAMPGKAADFTVLVSQFFQDRELEELGYD